MPQFILESNDRTPEGKRVSQAYLDRVLPAAVQAIGEAAWRVKKDAILLCHGGPIAEPEHAAFVLARCDAVGFVGASSMERLPVERALTEQTQRFKSVPLRGA